MKKCVVCGEEKDVSEFWSERSKKCLQCRDKYKKDKGKKNRSKPEAKKYMKEYLKEYWTRPEVIEHKKQYRSKPETKELTKKSEAKRMKNSFYVAMSKIHKQAHRVTQELIRDKKILTNKLQKCAICNKSWSGKNSIEFHHFNYNFIKIIVPLCAEHHSKVHAENPTIYPKSAFDGIDIPETHKDKIILI